MEEKRYILVWRDNFNEVEKLDYDEFKEFMSCLLYTSPSPRDATLSRMPSSA